MGAVAKAGRAALLGQRNRVVEARARALSSALSKWLTRYARLIVPQELERALGRVRKAWDEERAREELGRLLRLFGLRQLQEGATSAGGGDVVIDAQAVQEFLSTKTVQVQGIMEETRDAVRESIRRLIAESLQERPQPSASELARRVRSQYFGPEDARPFEVSSERAALIARTELAQAENTGIVEGYRATGVDEIEWIAYADGRSGDRRHDLMDGKRVRVGESFTTPLGNKLRYPGDPLAPIKETANCRCTVAPVRRPRR